MRYLKHIATIILVSGMALHAADSPMPNILFILADDLGKEWIGCYGAEDISTPYIDALAAGGMKFNNAWFMPFATDNGSTGRITGTINGRKVKGSKAKTTEAGVCAPFTVNAAGLVPSKVETDALTEMRLMPVRTSPAGRCPTTWS